MCTPNFCLDPVSKLSIKEIENNSAREVKRSH
ncbi:AAA family ATPase, partial [Leptospira borgpetersenii]